jgi:hypothetical protein
MQHRENAKRLIDKEAQISASAERELVPPA